MRWVAGIIVMLTAPAVLAAEPAIDDLKKCAEHAEPAKRLACYDKELPPAKGPDTPSAAAVDWFLSKEKLTDAPEAFIHRASGGDHPVLWGIRCRDDTTSTLLVLDTLVGNEEVSVQYRFDDKAAITASWMPSTGGQAIGLWSGRDAIPFIRAAMASKTLSVSVEPKGGSRIDVKFDIGGLEAALKPVRTACKW